MAEFGRYFTYNGKSSEDFDLMIVRFKEIDEVPLALKRTILSGETNQYRFRANHFGTKYDDVLKFEVTCMRKSAICSTGDPDDLTFTRSELRKITTWLTEPALPSLFHMTDYPNTIEADEQYDYFAIVSDIESTYINGIVALTFNITCDCPFAYSEEKKYELTTTGTMTVVNNSDNTEGFIYPVVTIKPNAYGTISIANDRDSKSMKFQLDQTKGWSNVIIDCSKMTVVNTEGTYIPLSDLNVNDPTNVYWLRLYPGNNGITVTGSISNISITYREYRKVGAY